MLTDWSRCWHVCVGDMFRLFSTLHSAWVDWHVQGSKAMQACTYIRLMHTDFVGNVHRQSLSMYSMLTCVVCEHVDEGCYCWHLQTCKLVCTCSKGWHIVDTTWVIYRTRMHAQWRQCWGCTMQAKGRCWWLILADVSCKQSLVLAIWFG